MGTTEFTSYLPKVRCSRELRNDLAKITKLSVARNMADHIRFAVEQYVERELLKVQADKEESAEAKFAVKEEETV